MRKQHKQNPPGYDTHCARTLRMPPNQNIHNFRTQTNCGTFGSLAADAYEVDFISIDALTQ